MSSTLLTSAEYLPVHAEMPDAIDVQGVTTDDVRTAEQRFEHSGAVGALLMRFRDIVRLLSPHPPLHDHHKPPTPIDIANAAARTDLFLVELEAAMERGDLGEWTSQNRIPLSSADELVYNNIIRKVREVQPMLHRLARTTRETATYRSQDLTNILTKLRSGYNELQTLSPSPAASPIVADAASQATASGDLATDESDTDAMVPPLGARTQTWSASTILSRLQTMALWLDVHENAPASYARATHLLQIGTEAAGMRRHVANNLSLDQRASQSVVANLSSIAHALKTRSLVARMPPVALRQLAYQVRNVEMSVGSLLSAGVLLNDDALLQASARANQNLVQQWKASTPDVLDAPLRVLAAAFYRTWSRLMADVQSDKVWGAFTDETDPDYTAEVWVKWFVVVRRIGAVLVEGNGERLLHVGVGVALAGMFGLLLAASC